MKKIRKEIKGMQLERKTKLSPFLDDRIVYVEYTKEPSPPILPLKNTCGMSVSRL